jgi:hypothetical protein
MLARTDYRTLISLGRKAGLRTTELYSAMAARRPEAGDGVADAGDGNGYVPGYSPNGQRVFCPAPDRSRS